MNPQNYPQKRRFSSHGNSSHRVGVRTPDPKWFFSEKRGKPMHETIRPWEQFIVDETFRAKRSFPFLTPNQALKKHLALPEDRTKTLEKWTLRIIPLGWCEQVGLNSMIFEYEDEILIIDLGLQFPDQYQYWINSSIPDLSYLRGKKVVGACITHGHIDHIGAVFYSMEQIGRNVPIFATPMAYELIKLKQWEYKATLPRLQEYHREKPIQIWQHFQVTPFTVDHSIPDSVWLLIETPVGRFVHTGDWKFDKNPLPHRPSTNYSYLDNIWKRWVRALFSDSTNAHLLWSSISESEVIHSIEVIFEQTKGRIITGTFSSIIDRVMLIITTAEKFWRKVVLLGRSMNNYVDIAVKLGYMKPKSWTIISMEDASKLPDNQVTICCTGAQGERYAALTRIVTGESRDTDLKPWDTVVFSSSVIPGNERAVQWLMDLISQQWATIHHYRESEIHAWWHARAEDTKKMISLIHPEYYFPIYWFPHMLFWNAKNAYALWYPEEKVVIMRNGMVVEFTKNSVHVTNSFISKKLVTVDGRMVGYTTERELHDRYQLAQHGILIVGITKKNTGYLIKYEAVWLPPIDSIPRLENALDATIKNILHDIANFKDVHSFTSHVEKRVTDTVLNEIGKEPKVIVVVQ